MRKVLLAAIGLTSLAVTSSANATTLAYDGFTGYANGNNNIVGDNGGTGWNGAWNSGQSDGFLHTVRTATNQFTYTGYNATTTPAMSGGNYLNLADGFGGSNPVGVYRGMDTSAGGTFGSNGYVSGGQIGADNTTVWGSFFYKDNDTGQGSNNTFSWQLDGPAHKSQTIIQSNGTGTHLIVFKVAFGAGATDTLTFWGDPVIASFNGTGGTTLAAGDYSFNTLGFVVQGVNTPGNGGSETQIDDIRFGTSSGDVVPLVPEPTSASLIGLTGLLLTRRRAPRKTH